MLRISCRKCQKKYELENSACGRQFACGCGHKFPIPELSLVGDFQACPTCGGICSEGSVICTECGYNYRTGKKIIAAKNNRDDDDEPGFWFKYGHLLKKLILLAVIAVVGFFIYHSYTAKPFGIAPGIPLGTITEVHKFLKELNFDCNETLAPAQYPDCKISVYTNAQKAKETRGLIDENIILMSDRSGKITGAIGNYSVPDGNISATGTVVSRFFRRMQEELGVPAKPEFKQVTRGTGMLKATEDICNWQSSESKIFWIKITHSQGLIASTNNLTITTKNISPEKFFSEFSREF
jgi:hypothetical protein